MSLLRIITITAVCLCLSACGIFSPYHIQIQQGQKLTAEQIKQIKPGMSKDQVSFILGTPNLVDAYHPQDWYYIYTNQLSNRPRTEKKFVVHFNSDDKVASISGDYPPPSELKYTTYKDK